MPSVKFNEVEEFLREMEKEASYIQPYVVRITNMFRRGEANTEFVSVRAGFICYHELGFRDRRGFYIRLDAHVGQTWPDESMTKETMDKALAIREKIEAKCKELNLEVRGGVYD